MITILMTTYNGDKFIDDQLKSIFSQTFKEFKLIIQDDCSTDQTMFKLKQWKKKHPDQIAITQRVGNSGTAKINFFELMVKNKDDYIMLSDQDDVWLPNKIEKTLIKMKKMENQYGISVPILVHSDLQVVGENLNLLHRSYEKAANADYRRTKLNYIIVQNVVAGCTAMYNRALSEYLIDMPEYFVMHDWWIALVASAFGEIDHVDESLILYRQHEKNEMGAVSAKSLSYQIKRFVHNEAVKESLKHTYLQAGAFYNMYKTQLSDSHKSLVLEYSKISEKSKLKRVLTICKLGTIKNGIARKIANFLFV